VSQYAREPLHDDESASGKIPSPITYLNVTNSMQTNELAACMKEGLEL